MAIIDSTILITGTQIITDFVRFNPTKKEKYLTIVCYKGEIATVKRFATIEQALKYHYQIFKSDLLEAKDAHS